MDHEKQSAESRKMVAMRAALAPRLRYTPQMRAQAVTYARRRLTAGAGLQLIARELRVDRPTLKRWLGADDMPVPAFRTVQVEEAPARPALVLHGPAGLRIEGLDIAGLAELLRRLR